MQCNGSSARRETLRPGQHVAHRLGHWEHEDRLDERQPAGTSSSTLSNYTFPHILTQCKLNVPVQAVEVCGTAEV